MSHGMSGDADHQLWLKQLGVGTPPESTESVGEKLRGR